MTMGILKLLHFIQLTTHHQLNSLVLSVVDWQDNPVGIISTANWDLVNKDVISIHDVVEALTRLIDPVEAVLVHINGDHLHMYMVRIKTLHTYVVQHTKEL